MLHLGLEYLRQEFIYMHINKHTFNLREDLRVYFIKQTVFQSFIFNMSKWHFSNYFRAVLIHHRYVMHQSHP